MNIVLIEGNLGRDPELKYTNSGTAVCKFSIGSNFPKKVGDEWKSETTWVDVTVWEKLAENCGEHLKKGTHVRVQGRLKQDKWEHEGKNYSKMYVVAFKVEWYAKKGESKGAGKPREGDGEGWPSGGDDVPQGSTGSGSPDTFEDDIPF